MTTEEKLFSIGFNRKNISHPVMAFWEFKSKSDVVVMVQVFPGGKWEPFIVLRGKPEAKEITLSRPLNTIKDLTDLEDFIYYL